MCISVAGPRENTLGFEQDQRSQTIPPPMTITQPNPTELNPTEPSSTQPNLTQLNLTQHNTPINKA